MVGSTPFEQLIGKVLGNYRVTQLLEAHKWGPVFLASDRTGGQYLIRFIGMPLVEDKTNKLSPAERMVTLGHLQQEANKLAVLAHPHIVPQVDYGTYQGILYLVYRYLKYTPLRLRVTPNTLPSPAGIGRFLEQIAGALEYAHNQGVLHRNLSSGSIFVPDGNQVLVGELGLLHLREMSLSGLPWTGNRADRYEGSTESCAPEQLLGRPVDVYTDIYAMGAVLYRMLTGHAPFSGQGRDEILQQHLYAKVPSLKVWRDDLPIDLDHIIAKAMAKEPPDRFKHPASFVKAYYQIIVPEQGSQSSKLNSVGRMSATSSKHLTAPVVGQAPKTDAKRSNVLKENNVSRRRFVTMASAGAGVAVVVGAAVIGTHLLSSHTNSAAASTTDAQSVTRSASASILNSNIVAKVADLSANKSAKFVIPGQQNPGILVHLPNDSFVAFNSTCPHAGCAVDYNTQSHLLVCPCHDAMFDPAKNGDVVQGPATKALTPVKVMVNPNGTITTG